MCVGHITSGYPLKIGGVKNQLSGIAVRMSGQDSAVDPLVLPLALPSWIPLYIP
jgi:hypothetical protein